MAEKRGSLFGPKVVPTFLGRILAKISLTMDHQGPAFFENPLDRCKIVSFVDRAYKFLLKNRYKKN